MFTFKGKNSVDMGVFAREENFLGKAPVKYESIEIDGKDGEEIIPLNFQNFIGTLEDVVLMKDNRDEVLNWLSGKGELVYLGKKTTVHFLDGYEVKKHNRPFGISFIRDPFWSPYYDHPVTALGSITNNGNVTSKPIIRLTKKNEQKAIVKVNDVTLEYEFGTDDHVEIDCEEMSATCNGLMRNRQLKIGFEYPKLTSGNNQVKLMSGDATIEFRRKDLWL